MIIKHIFRKSVFLLLFLFSFSAVLWAQQSTVFVEGEIFEKGEEGQDIPLVGANIIWSGTQIGVYTDENGRFRLEESKSSNQLIISYVGYPTDTVVVNEPNQYFRVYLSSSVSLDELEIVYREKSTETSMLSSMKVEKIGEKELMKAACCNLSESFETSPSVDVSFTDAITGTRQIQLLGLAGPYTQITRELIPSIRGLSSIYGLTFIPGSWVQSMQLSKGTGTVVNGFESIAGQINVELRKPEAADRLFVNLYANEGGRYEGNVNLSHKFKGGKWSTAALLHGKSNQRKWDRNEDGFLDMPLGENWIGLNRWKYQGVNGVEMQFGLKGTSTSTTGGQVDFVPSDNILSANTWGMQMDVRRVEGWFKMGKVFLHKPWKSLGLQLSAVDHQQDSYFGRQRYDADQSSFFANLLYQSILADTDHSFLMGASFQYDRYQEFLGDRRFERQESVPGVFFEYNFIPSEKFSLIAGLRGDYHNLFGAFVTPRLHLRFAPAENTVFRASGGRGQRTANIIADNSGILASARQIIIEADNPENPYGLEPEIAWNLGVNFIQKFELNYREGSFSLDLYRTSFQQQVVMDLDINPQEVHFYNLDGASYSNSFQAQVDYEVLKRLDLRLAYRWLEVKTDYVEGLREKPLVSANRAFINLAYESRSHWKLDFTMNWQGSKRIPFTDGNPVEYTLAERSPSFTVMNTQISKTWRENFEVYLGGENLLNFRQEDPILSAEQPFSDFFDSSLVWGPIFGRNIYLGIRYNLK